MVTIEQIDECIKESQRFIKKAREAKKRIKIDKFAPQLGSKETAAVKRASMDLSRSLADLRRSRGWVEDES